MSDSASVGSCLGCTGYCCLVYSVPVIGYDVWRIVQGQRLAPTLFVQCDPEDMPTDIGFLLRAPGPTYGLSLRHSPRPHTREPCVFLMQLRDGVYRCGIYSDRPLVCQTYPMRMNETSIFVRSDALCPPGSWANLDQVQTPWRERLQLRQTEWQRYGEVVAIWNAMVRTCSAPAGFELDTYLAYLINAYDLITRAPTADGATRLAHLAAGYAQAKEDGAHT